LEYYSRRNSLPSQTVQYPFRLPVSAIECRSIELEQLRRILAVMERYYVVETGYKRVPHGGYIPEYKLSIPHSETHNRISRFQKALQVPPPSFPSRSRVPSYVNEAYKE
jgi:hypothetical protein